MRASKMRVLCYTTYKKLLFLFFSYNRLLVLSNYCNFVVDLVWVIVFKNLEII